MRLCLETSSSQGSVALCRDGELVESRLLGKDREHARYLAPTVAELLQDRFHELTGYAISIGPGSFTGLRIGLSFLKGLAAAHPRPSVSVSSLEVRAFSLDLTNVQRTEREVLVLLDARRGQVFAGRFDASGAVAEDGLFPLEDIVNRFSCASLWVAGDGVPQKAPMGWHVVDADAPPRAEVVGQRAELRFIAKQTCEAGLLDPAYLQLSGAEERFGPAPGSREAGDTPILGGLT